MTAEILDLDDLIEAVQLKADDSKRLIGALARLVRRGLASAPPAASP